MGTDHGTAVARAPGPGPPTWQMERKLCAHSEGQGGAQRAPRTPATGPGQRRRRRRRRRAPAAAGCAWQDYETEPDSHGSCWRGAGRREETPNIGPLNAGTADTSPDPQIQPGVTACALYPGCRVRTGTRAWPQAGRLAHVHSGMLSGWRNRFSADGPSDDRCPLWAREEPSQAGITPRPWLQGLKYGVVSPGE